MKYPYVKRLPSFNYLTPKTIDEAISLLSQHDGKAVVMSGGTDLLNKMKKREVTPQYLIGLRNISGLDNIEHDAARGLRVGPLVTVHAIETSPVIRDKFPILAQAASSMASAQIRNLGTVVGNLCSAVPSADMAPGLIVLGASLKIAGTKGERTVSVEDFFTGPQETVLAPGELVVEVQVPNPPPNTGMVYIKHMLRSAMDLAIVGVAALVTMDGNVCREVKIGLGAVAPTPIRATNAEAILRGKPFDAELVKEAAEMACQACSTISDIRATTEYRDEMVRVLTRRALNQAREQAK